MNSLSPVLIDRVLAKTASTADMETAARAFATYKGWKGARSGWIYSPKTGRTLCQGYYQLYIKYYVELREWVGAQS